jgi:RNA polymerase sigma-70 factor (ECF subfamily)
MLTDQAFTEFYSLTSRALRNYAARVLGSISEADDVVQESYLRIMRHPPPTTDHGELRAYLFRVASNLMTDRWRRRRHESSVRALPEPHSEPHDGALRVDMERTFLRLRPRDRQLMWLAYVEGASHREIAASLGLRESSIRPLLARAREKLSTLLQDTRGKGLKS